MVKSPIARLCVLVFFGIAFLEIRIYLMACAGFSVPQIPGSGETIAHTFVNHPWGDFDPVRGVRIRPGNLRMMRTFNHETVFDANVQINQQGFVTTQEFSPKKKDGVFRIIVLGDSFTAAEYFSTPWPDRVNEILRARGAEPAIEIYSFAVDPGTTDSWTTLFFKEIIPNYEFDAVIIAAQEYRFNMGIPYAHTENNEVLLGYAFPLPQNIGEVRKHLAKMFPIMTVVSDAEMDRRRTLAFRLGFPAPYFYFTKFLFGGWRGIVASAASRIPGDEVPQPLAPATPPIDENDLFAYWRDGALSGSIERFKMVLDWCRENRKPMVLTSIPLRSDMGYEGLRWERHFPEALRHLAAAYGFLYFDSRPAFSALTEGEIAAQFLRYDAHWNQDGSDRFAVAIAEFIHGTWARPGTRPPRRNLATGD